VESGAQLREYVPEPCAGFRSAALDIEFLERLCEHLREQGERLRRERSVEQIIAVLDGAAAHWLERVERDTELMEEISRHTGLSRPMVERCIQAEQTSSRAADLRETLDAELGHRGCLDGFVWQPHLKRHVRAYGPGLTLGILPGNIPGLSHLPMMRALLVKSAFLGKCAAGEPYYAAAYARSVAEIDPLVGSCLTVLDWRRGEVELLDCAIRHADAVIAYGTEATVSAIGERVPRTKTFVPHGHKLGIVLIEFAAARDQLEEVCSALAVDVAMYDQQACLAPQLIVSIGSPADAQQLGSALAASMEGYHRRLPRTEPTLNEAAGIRRYLDEVEWSGGQAVASGPWGAVVALPPEAEPTPSCGFRTAQIVPVETIEGAVARVRTWEPWLQNAAVLASEDVSARLSEEAARLGCTRITQLGAMPFPSMRWHHDGRPCVSDLVRFCDIEGAAEVPLEEPVLRFDLPRKPG
jgi:hypothetical protein